MKAILSGSVTVAYYISVLAFPPLWGRVFTAISASLDLTPEQTPLLPMTFNLLAAAFGVPVVVLLIRRSPSVCRSRARVIFSAVCIAAVVMLVIAAARWVIRDRRSLTMGVREAFHGPATPVPHPSLRIEGGVFRDRELGFEVEPPRGWRILSPNAIRRLCFSADRAISSFRTAPIPNQLPEGEKLFLVLQKNPETYQDFNPTLGVVSYEKDVMLRSGIPSLQRLLTPFTRSAAPFKNLTGMIPRKIGEFDGYEVRQLGEFPDQPRRLHIFGFETEHHYIAVTAVFQDINDRDAMIKAIGTIKGID